MASLMSSVYVCRSQPLPRFCHVDFSLKPAPLTSMTQQSKPWLHSTYTSDRSPKVS